jgi:excisionase family DNA binding protein
MTTRYLKLSEAAAQLGVSIGALRDLIKTGELVAPRLGSRQGLRVSEDDVRAFINRRRSEAIARTEPKPRRKRAAAPARVSPSRLEW